MTAPPPQVTMDQLMQMMAQLINAQQNNGGAAVQNNQPAVPALPDIIPFEPSEEKSRFEEWIQRFKFAIDCVSPNLDQKIKVKALMNKLSEAAFSEYTKFCLPAEVTDFNFDITVKKLDKLFSRPHSIFVDRFECLKATKDENEDFRSFINRHKRLLRDFKYTQLTEEQFKVLMLLLALKAPKDHKDKEY